MKELKFVLTTPHGTQIEISKKAGSDTIFLQYCETKHGIVQTFDNVSELSEHLKKHIFGPVFGILA
jgi:hypothetical protein